MFPHSHSRLPTGIRLKPSPSPARDDTLIDGDIPYIVQVAVDAVNTLDANFASLPAQRRERH
jgi:hypothetical protein